MSVDSQVFPPSRGRVFFDRRELNRILNLYGRMVALGIGFTVFLYATGVPATFLYEQHPQYKPLFVATLALDGIATVAFMWFAIRWYRQQLRATRPSNPSNLV